MVPAGPSPDGSAQVRAFSCVARDRRVRVAHVEGQNPGHPASRSCRQHWRRLRHGVGVAGRPDVVLRELEGLRALARALVGGDADADDLLQEPRSPRSSTRRHSTGRSDHGSPPCCATVAAWICAPTRGGCGASRWSRSTRRVDGRPPARRSIARACSSACLARWSHSTSRFAPSWCAATSTARRGRDRSCARRSRGHRALAAQDRPRATARGARRHAPDWRAALIPCLQGAAIVKTKLGVVLIIVALLLAGAWWRLSRRAPVTTTAAIPAVVATSHAVHAAPPQPGQARASAPRPSRCRAARSAGASSTGRPATACPTPTSRSRARPAQHTIRTVAGGAFELAPSEPGAYVLATINAAGYLPYAPELDHSPIHVQFRKGRTVDGITVFLYPALDYHGIVVDASKTPVAGAHVALLGSPPTNRPRAVSRPSGRRPPTVRSRSTRPTTPCSRRAERPARLGAPRRQRRDHQAPDHPARGRACARRDDRRRRRRRARSTARRRAGPRHAGRAGPGDRLGPRDGVRHQRTRRPIRARSPRSRRATSSAATSKAARRRGLRVDGGATGRQARARDRHRARRHGVDRRRHAGAVVHARGACAATARCASSSSPARSSIRAATSRSTSRRAISS